MSLSGFGDELGDLLLELRELANSRMGATNGGSTGTIRRPNSFTTDPDGNKVPAWLDVHVDLPARVDYMSTNGGYRSLEAAGVEAAEADREIHFAADTTDVRAGDHFEVTAGESVGLVVRILAAKPADQKTALRVLALTVPRPEEWV